MKRHSPPPTKFGPVSVQPKAQSPVVRAPVPPPPVTFGSVAAVGPVQARNGAPPYAPRKKPTSQLALGQAPKSHYPCEPALTRPILAQPKSAGTPPPPVPSRYKPIPAPNTVQPLLIGGLIVGALGAAYAGYRYYRYRRRENIISQIRQEHAGLAPVIVNSTENHGGIGRTSYAETRDSNVTRPNRRYNVYINRDDPVGAGTGERALVESARVHELTHVAADQSYSANLTIGRSQHTYNTHGVYLVDRTYHDYPVYDRADRLITAIDGDRALTHAQRRHLRSRVKDNAIKPNEWDSTINELLVYTREAGIRSNSSTVKLLVEYARENLDHRQGRVVDLPRLTPIGGNAFHTGGTNWRNV